MSKPWGRNLAVLHTGIIKIWYLYYTYFLAEVKMKLKGFVIRKNDKNP